MASVNSGLIGAALTVTSTTPSFAVGTRATTSDGGVVVYVKAASAITAYDFLSIDEDFQASPLSTSNDDDAIFVGVSQVAVASASYAWVYLSGANIIGSLLGVTDIVPQSGLAASATAGYLTIYSTTTQIQLLGVMSVVTASVTTSCEVLLSSPMFQLPKS